MINACISRIFRKRARGATMTRFSAPENHLGVWPVSQSMLQSRKCLGLFGSEQGFQGFLVTLGFRPEQPGHRGNLGRKTHY